MLRQTLTLATIVAVLLHAVSGCCLHHPHAGHYAEQSVTSAGDLSGNCQHQHAVAIVHCANRSDGLPESVVPEDCDEPQCHLASVSRSELSQVRLVVASHPHVAGAVANQGTGASVARHTGGRASNRLLLCLPLRSQTQVWLI